MHIIQLLVLHKIFFLFTADQLPRNVTTGDGNKVPSLPSGGVKNRGADQLATSAAGNKAIIAAIARHSINA